MAASPRSLISPTSPEYAQGRTAFLEGESYETCPHKPARKGLSFQRTNWFEGYWDARSEYNRKEAKPVNVPYQLRMAPPTDSDLNYRGTD